MAFGLKSTDKSHAERIETAKKINRLQTKADTGKATSEALIALYELLEERLDEPC